MELSGNDPCGLCLLDCSSGGTLRVETFCRGEGVGMPSVCVWTKAAFPQTSLDRAEDFLSQGFAGEWELLWQVFSTAQKLQGAGVSPVVLVHVLCEGVTHCHIAAEDQPHNKLYIIHSGPPHDWAVLFQPSLMEGCQSLDYAIVFSLISPALLNVIWQLLTGQVGCV